MYRVLILDEAWRDLAGMDKPVARRITQRINWLAENIDRIKPESLTGEYSRFLKFRVGDYRVLYKIIPDDRSIVVHRVGHRRDIYR